MEILFPITFFSVLGMVVAAAAFIVARMRSGAPVLMSFHSILVSYFFLMTTVSFFIVVSGITDTVKVGLTLPFGREFSYWTPVPMRPVPPPEPGASGPGTRPQPPSEEEAARAQREVERQLQDDLIQGGTLMVVGGLFWALHRGGRRAVAGRDPDAERCFAQSQTTIMLVVTGIVGLMSVAVGAYELLRYIIVVRDEFGGRQAPGEAIAAALVFVPAWLSFLSAVIRRSGQPENGS